MFFSSIAFSCKAQPISYESGNKLLDKGQLDSLDELITPYIEQQPSVDETLLGYYELKINILASRQEIEAAILLARKLLSKSELKYKNKANYWSYKAYQHLSELSNIVYDLNRSLDYASQALEICKEIYPERHLQTAQAYMALATIYGHMLNIKMSNRYARKVLASVPEDVPAHAYIRTRPKLLIAVNNQALFDQTGQLSFLDKAKTLLTGVVKQIANMVPKDKQRVEHYAYYNLGNVYFSKQNYADARKYWRKAAEAIQAPKSPTQAAIEHAIMSSYGIVGDFNKALLAGRKALVANSYDLRADLDPYENPQLIADTVDFLYPIYAISGFRDGAVAYQELFNQTNKKTYLDSAIAVAEAAFKLSQRSIYEARTAEDKLSLFRESRNVNAVVLGIYMLAYAKQYMRSELKNKILQVVEGNRSIALLAAIQTDNAIQIGGVPDSLQTEKQVLEQRIHELDAAITRNNFLRDKAANKGLTYQIIELKDQLEKLLNYLHRKYPNFKKLQGEREGLNLVDF